MNPLGHILIVDDDRRICELLKRFLVQNDYLVSTASSVAACEGLMGYYQFDLIILDVMMPGETGPDFLKRKGKLNMPVIMLSALGNVDDRIGGLESGADDYLPKPFEPKELLVRMKKLISRTTKLSEVRFGPFIFNLITRTLYKSGKLIDLTSSEKKIIHKLAETSNSAVSKYDFDLKSTQSRAIDTQIARLRLKIEADPKNPLYLQTVRGEGYVLSADH